MRVARCILARLVMEEVELYIISVGEPNGMHLI